MTQEDWIEELHAQLDVHRGPVKFILVDYDKDKSTTLRVEDVQFVGDVVLVELEYDEP